MTGLRGQYGIERTICRNVIVQPATGMRQRELCIGSLIVNLFNQMASRRHVAAPQRGNAICEKARPSDHIYHRRTIARRSSPGIVLSAM
ncbi:hypothetical protein U1839_16720 [Sphingomonas sp. RT2P30]|uniref:hypothetical protein n=1 Tax=Parasphingomonas halimpatiens TaxID=3096162 RepID=UPI002FC9F1DE